MPHPLKAGTAGWTGMLVRVRQVKGANRNWRLGIAGAFNCDRVH
jgi:hypothetical protein